MSNNLAEALPEEITRARKIQDTFKELRAAISWIEPPFIDENTSEAELRKRISFCVEDAKKALKGPTP